MGFASNEWDLASVLIFNEFQRVFFDIEIQKGESFSWFTIHWIILLIILGQLKW